MAGHLHKVAFDKIRYSNCWEDADLLLHFLKPTGKDVVLSVGSAGDNSFSLLACSPKKVIACDVSPVQLMLIELKKTAFQTLSHDEFLGFLGFQHSTKRLAVFKEKIRVNLSKDALIFWEENLSLISKGIIHAGKLERYLAFYRKYFQWLLASPRLIRKYYHEHESQDWSAIIDRRVNSIFVKSIFHLMFNKYILGLFGRSTYFVKEVEITAHEYFYKQFQRFLQNKDSHRNFYIHYLSMGTFYPELPHYARLENFEVIKANLDKLELRKGYLEDILQEEREVSMVNASNIFEYMPLDEFQRFAKSLANLENQTLRIAYWNLMVDRVLSECGTGKIKPAPDLDKLPDDRLFFYKRFVGEEMQYHNS